MSQINPMDRLPTLRLVRQQFQTPREADVRSAVGRELGRLNLSKVIRPGDSVALTAGSRGIADIVPILAETVRTLRAMGARPFVVPAMGSHGGGTSAGQVAVLAGYGITEEGIGAPIEASMDVVEIGRHPVGGPVFIDRIASRADHIGIVARIKPHTGFSGSIESGLVKMMMIGLGKHEGAKEYHRVLIKQPWEPFARSVAPIVLTQAPVRFGLAIIENARDETALIEGVRGEDFLIREPALLEQARGWMPGLPVDEVDLLIIDEIGKDISGSGADTNVIGRKPTGDWNERDLRNTRPLVHRIFVRGLSAHAQGNAAGIGLADFTTDRLLSAMDYSATVINCLTANHPLAAAVPVHFPSDRAVIDAALGTVGLSARREAKIAWIQNTLKLETLALSEAYDDALRLVSGARVIGEWDWSWNEAGDFPMLADLFRG